MVSTPRAEIKKIQRSRIQRICCEHFEDHTTEANLVVKYLVHRNCVLLIISAKSKDLIGEGASRPLNRNGQEATERVPLQEALDDKEGPEEAQVSYRPLQDQF